MQIRVKVNAKVTQVMTISIPLQDYGATNIKKILSLDSHVYKETYLCLFIVL